MPSTVSYPSITSNQPNHQSINQPMNQSNHQSIQYNAMAIHQSLSKISIINSKLIKNKNNSPPLGLCNRSQQGTCKMWPFSSNVLQLLVISHPMLLLGLGVELPSGND
jgi:hypothetical protein